VFKGAVFRRIFGLAGWPGLPGLIFGVPVQKTLGGVVTDYIYDLAGHAIAEVNASGSAGLFVSPSSKILLLANGNVRGYEQVICPLLGFYFPSPEGAYDPPPELWERGNPAVFAGFPSAGENLVLVFPAASFPQLFPGSFSAAKRPTQCGP